MCVHDRCVHCRTCVCRGGYLRSDDQVVVLTPRNVVLVIIGKLLAGLDALQIGRQPYEVSVHAGGYASLGSRNEMGS